MPRSGISWARRISKCELCTLFYPILLQYSPISCSFNMNMRVKETEEEYMTLCARGARKFILKEKDEDLPKARLHMRM